jgi:thiol:disulfide interchange protein DsbD
MTYDDSGLPTWRRRLLGAAAALVALLSLSGARAEEDLLRPEDAFRYSATASGDAVIVDWDIAPGYYLYRGRMSYASRTAGIALLDPEYPQGESKEDEFFGKQEIYHGHQQIRIPYSRIAQDAKALTLELKVQGCAEAGVCYPPQTWTTEVSLDGTGSRDLSGAISGSTGGSSSADGGTAAGASEARSGASSNLLEQLARDPQFGDAQREFLPPDEAFRFDAQMADPYTIRAHWNIADGYYLYRSKFQFAAPGAGAQLGAPSLPAGTREHDENFGDSEVYYSAADVLVPISRASPSAGELELKATYQGCAKDGICYPPITRTALLMIPEARASDGPSAIVATTTADAGSRSGQDRFASIITGDSIPVMAGLFFLAGLGLAFTPCVLPMVPILSGLIVGQGPALRTSRAFALSLAYVLAMALTYTAAGVVTALLGRNLQAAFQAPLVLVAFSILFVAFGLAMLGAFELQMPAAIQSRLTSLSNRQQGGTLVGVTVMGVLSSLIVGPCVAAPIAGALVVIGQSGDPVRGGLALFALSMGMGAPLLAFGTSAGRLLPRAGVWMESIKKAFGILMFGVALWLLSRLLPPTVSLLAWGALVAFAGVLLMTGGRRTPGLAGSLARAFGVGAFVYAALTVVGAAAGGTDPLRPLAGTPMGGERTEQLAFKTIKSTDDLDRELADASGRLVMLDFYADWCVSCKEIEKYTFSDGDVQAALRDVVLLRADVTANDEADRALLARFGIFGPPTIAFFGPDGKERKPQRVVGFVPADEFQAHVAAVRGAG